MNNAELAGIMYRKHLSPSSALWLSFIPFLDLCLSMGATELMMNSVIAKANRVVYVIELYNMTIYSSWASRSAVTYIYTRYLYTAE